MDNVDPFDLPKNHQIDTINPIMIIKKKNNLRALINIAKNPNKKVIAKNSKTIAKISIFVLAKAYALSNNELKYFPKN